MSVSFAGCSADTARFAENPFNRPPEATGSVQQQPAQHFGPVERQPLPAQAAAQPAPTYQTSSLPPLAPAQSMPAQTYNSQPSYNSAQSGGGHGLSSYAPPSKPIETTSSTTPRSVAAVSGWSKEGGTKIIVGTSDNLDTLAQRYNVPASAILEANALHGPRSLSPGQSLVIPRRTGSAPSAVASAPAIASPPATRPAAVAAAPGSKVHVAGTGDTLMSIARRNNIAVADLAKANKMSTTTKLKVGDKVTVPGGAKVAAVEAPKAAQAKAAPVPAVQQAAAPAPVATEKAALASAKDQPAAEPAAKETTNATPGFRWPAKGRVIAAYGAKTNGKQNDGINLSLPEGTPVKAADDGVVAYSGNELKGYGNLILVRHSNGYVTAYAHASELMVKRGDTIKRGQIIAKSGQTGEVGSPQLHFEIRKGSTPVDPAQFLDGGV